MGTVHGREEGARDEGRRGPGMGGGRWPGWEGADTYTCGQSFLPILNTTLSLSTLAPGSSLTRYSTSPEGNNAVIKIHV